MKIFKKKSNRFKKFGDSFGRMQTAVTYAEAGSHEDAIRTMEAPKPKSAIVVLGQAHNFSPQLREYAIGLARRLDYDILAVNARHIHLDIASLAERAKQDFTERCAQSAALFQSEAMQAGVGFTHTVQFGEGTDVIKELHKELSNLEYVVCEPDECKEGEPEPAIPVFSLAWTQ
ncbi:MAG: hypothetical protein ACLFOY_17905 [Desulfatibacillaceae bacterium]